MTIKMQNAIKAIDLYMYLRKIAKSLHTLAEKSCKFGLTSAQEKRVDKLISEAQNEANLYGFKIYYQSDPRVPSLYLGDKTMNKINYYSFISVY